MKYFLLILTMIAMLATYFYRRRLDAMGMDMMNVYKLRFRGVPVYTRYRRFLRAIGLPRALYYKNETIPVESRGDIDRFLGGDYDMSYNLDFLYDRFQMEHFADGRMVIRCMDMRNPDNYLEYGRRAVFDSEFTYEQFAELFSRSSRMSLSGIGIPSLFETHTGESNPDIDTYMVARWSKDNLLAVPTVEFTFLNGRLIYMFFANF